MWLSSQNDQNTFWFVIHMFGIGFWAFILTACNDTSIHQLNHDNQDNLRKVTVADIGSREGQIYARELRKKLHVGGKSNEAYRLISTIQTTSLSTLSVQGTASSLKKMSMTATFKLINVETGEALFSDTVSGDATLGSVSSFYGQDEAKSHARERLAILLAQRVGRRLQLYFLRQAQ